jgi:hypothetical protein
VAAITLQWDAEVILFSTSRNIAPVSVDLVKTFDQVLDQGAFRDFSAIRRSLPAKRRDQAKWRIGSRTTPSPVIEGV